MEIFRIRLDSNVFQFFLPVDTTIWQTDVLKMNCKPKLLAWNPPRIYVHNPTHEPSNFLHLCSGGLVTDTTATEKLRDVLEMAGGLLPLVHEDIPYYLLNVLECVNCLDQEKSVWVTGKTTKAK